jgi:hypothetical protein
VGWGAAAARQQGARGAAAGCTLRAAHVHVAEAGGQALRPALHAVGARGVELADEQPLAVLLAQLLQLLGAARAARGGDDCVVARQQALDQAEADAPAGGGGR